jgi:hypothetical protein
MGQCKSVNWCSQKRELVQSKSGVSAPARGISASFAKEFAFDRAGAQVSPLTSTMMELFFEIPIANYF